MTGNDRHKTIQKTEWTLSLLEDLLDALRANRDDATVRGFAKELMDEKDLTIGYLVQKASEHVGKSAGERLDVLVRGRYAIEKAKADRTKAEGGLLSGLMRKFRRTFAQDK